MSIQDFMTRELITIPPETPIYDALNIMEEKKLHRLPVVKQEQLVGLLTMGVIKGALPSQATSLSVYEVNYLLNQTTVAEIMIKDIITIEPNAQLEDGIYLMRQNHIGVLPVVTAEKLVGLITSNDIFDAFLNIAAYYQPGVVVTLKIEKDQPGVLKKLTAVLAAENYSITTLLVLRKAGTTVEVRLAGKETVGLKQLLETNGFQVEKLVAYDGIGK